MARKAIVHDNVGGFTVVELGKAPASRRSVLFRVFDHELNVHRRTGHEGLGAAEDFVKGRFG